MKRFNLLILFFTLILSFGCGTAPESIFAKESLSLYEKFSSGAIKQFVSKKNLASLLSREHYQIQARLTQDISSLELFSHSRASYLEDGVRIKIKRQNKDLLIEIGVEGYPNKSLLERKNYFEKQSEIDWTLGVENGTLYGFRVQIWENFLNKSSFIKRKTDILTPENKIADSLQEGLTFYTKGKGLSWGIKTYKTDLISAYRVPIQEL